MIRIYKNSLQQPKLIRIRAVEANAWICVTSPTEKELARIHKKLDIPLDDLMDATDREELPRIRAHDGKVFIILRAPKTIEGVVRTLPITIILTERNIVSISIESADVINDIIEKVTPIFTTQRSNFLIRVCLGIIERYQYHIARLGKTVQANKAALHTIERDDVLRLVELEEVLNNFINSLSPTISTIKKMLQSKYIALYQEDKELVDDVLIDGEQVLEFCITNLKTIRNIRDGYTTVMTMRLNQTIKVLTYLTAFLTIPMVVASAYGMNIRLPLADSPHAFAILALGTGALLALAWLVFARFKNRF